MYSLTIHAILDKILNKLQHKNSKQYIIISNKVHEILNNPYHDYKNLKKPLQKYKRVHIDKNYVLIFRVNHTTQEVILEHYDHHDYVYPWRPKE